MAKEEKILKIAQNKLQKLNDIVYDLYKDNFCQSNNSYYFLKDIVDLRSYYSAIIKKDYKKAYKIQINLDTDPREKIADSVYNFIDDLY